MTEVIVYLGTTALLLLCLYVYFPFAQKKGMLAGVNTRSSHHKPVVTGAGIIFAVSFLVCFVYMAVTDCYFPVCFAIGLLLLAAVSFADDIKDVWFLYRLVVQLLAVVLMIVQVIIDENTPEPITAVHGIVFGVLVVYSIFTTNLFNFMDGINGMLGLLALSIIIPLLLLEVFVVDVIDINLLVFALIPTLVFLFFNCRKKPKFFCGDVGSIVLGYFFTFVVIKLLVATGNQAYLFLFTIVYIEAGLTVLQRLLAGQNIFKPHRIHLFQLLCNEKQIPHVKVSACYGTIQLLIGLLIFAMNYYEVEVLIQNVVCVSIATILSLVYLYVKRKIMGGHLLDMDEKFIKQC